MVSFAWTNNLVNLFKGRDIMAAIDDLNNAVTALASGFANLDAAVQAELAALKAAVAANNTAGIEAAVTGIGSVTSKMAADAAALSLLLLPPAA
jgi:hypothetical protein